MRLRPTTRCSLSRPSFLDVIVLYLRWLVSLLLWFRFSAFRNRVLPLLSGFLTLPQHIVHSLKSAFAHLR